MKNLMLVIILVFSISVVGTSQVKEKFRDRDNSSTIVVIKDDKAIDTDLLDQHFDLSQMSMSDQIMITTKPDAPSIPEATPLPEEPSVPEAPAFDEATASIDDDVEVFFEQLEEEKESDKISDEENSETKLSNKLSPTEVKSNSAPKRAKGNYPTKSSYEVKKAVQKKYFAKSKSRKKRNKKKRRFGKKKSNSCYSF